MHSEHLGQCLAGGKLQTASSCCVIFLAWGCVHSEWRLGFGNHSFAQFFHSGVKTRAQGQAVLTHHLPVVSPCPGKAAWRQPGGRTRALRGQPPGPPQRSESEPALPDARSPATPTGPAASAFQDEAPGGCGDRQGRGQRRQTEGAEPPAWSLEGVPVLPATPWGEGGAASSSRPSSQRPLLSVGCRAQGAGRGGEHSLGTAHEEVDLQEVIQDGDCAGPDEA